MEDSHLLYSVEGNVGRITINREAQRNAVTAEAINLFHQYLDQAEKDPEVRVILITGAGDKAFCTGAQLGGGLAGNQGDIFSNYATLLYRIASCTKPTAARIKGYCLAGGLGFMLACDIVIAEENSKFGTPEVNVGLWPMMIGAVIFRNVLQKKAMEMIMLGERLSASEALSMGLITRVVPTDQLDEEVDTVLESLKSKSPIGIRIGKQAFQAVETMSLKDSLLYLSQKIQEVAGTKDAAEGITAFVEKRKPKFIGE